MQMDFHDYDPKYPKPNPKRGMGVVEAFCWFCIVPALSLALLMKALVYFGL